MRPNIIVKQSVVQAIKDQLTEAQALIVIEYHGLTVAAFDEVRQILKQFSAKVIIYKNRLFKKALIGSQYEAISDHLTGPNSFIFIGSDEAIAVAKNIAKLNKKYKKLRLKAAVIDSKVINRAELVALALLPTREESLAMLANSLQYPLVKFAIAIKEIAASKMQTAA